MWFRKLSIIRQRNITRQIVRLRSQTVSAPQLEEDVKSLKIGENVYGFEVRDIQRIKEFDITAIRLLHDRTKAEYLHLLRNDSNNVFSINFRTTPLNSTGLPHILEHTVLCGSKLFPVRDPFFKMLNRSLATFMNAMTGADYTMYPFSTQNLTDYRNLQRIYLDAVFRPNLKNLDFMQEGWRLENTDPNDITSEMVIKGVVYNEMKGAFSENNSILEQKLQNLILPDHTYGVCSGGDPLEIPNLTWEELKKFHANHYHPSNSKFYSYGNFPVLPTLEYLDVEYLRNFEYKDPRSTAVPAQKRWTDPKIEHISCRFDSMGDPVQKQNYITVALLMTDVTNNYETFLVQFLTELCIRGPNSPFYKSLIEPNFSGGYTQNTGYDIQTKDSIFILGLQGLQKNDFNKFVELFDKTVDDVINTGFDLDHIESVLHRYELGIKHETSNFGLSLLFGITSCWNHNGDIIESLKLNELIERLRKDMEKDPQFLQNSIKKYFKNNKHRLIMSMSPDINYEKKQIFSEKQLLKDKVAALSNEDIIKIYETGLELQKQQKEIQNINILPTLTMEDINCDVEKISKENLWFGPVNTQICKVNANEITYFRGVLNTSDLSIEQHMLLPLFCNVISKLGTNSMTYREFDSYASRKTSGLGFGIHLSESLYQLNTYEPGVYISSHCLDKNIEDMWYLWTQIFELHELKDVGRFETLLKMYMSNLTHGIADSGHIYAMHSAGSLVSGAAWHRDLLTGMQHIAFMKRLVKTANAKQILVALSDIAKSVFDKNKLRCALNLTPDSKQKIVPTFEKFISSLPGNAFGKPNERNFITKDIVAQCNADLTQCQLHVLNFPVHFCSKAVLTQPYTTPDYAKLRILARLLSAKYLHPELREKQGAYGGGARISTDGVFTFYTYRDPRHLATLDVFDQSHIWLQNELDKVTEQDILEAKLGVFQAVDAPVPPCDKGQTEFLRGQTADILQKHRSELMAVTLKGLREVGEKYLGEETTARSGKVILGPKNRQWDTTKRYKENWIILECV